MFDRKALKAEARLRMKESQPRYWKVMLIWTLAAVLAPTVVSGLAGGSIYEYSLMVAGGIDPAMLLSIFGRSVLVSMFLGIVVALYQCVMNFGLANYSLKLWRRQECGNGNLFEGFTMVWRVIGTQVLVTIFMILWGLLLSIPYMLVTMAASMMGGFGVFLAVLATFAYLAGVVAVTLKYSLTTLVLADQPELGAMGAIRRSKELMNGHKWAYFMLGFSFIGWSLLCYLLVGTLSGLSMASVIALPTLAESVLGVILCLPVYLWLGPYMQISYAGFYDALCSKKGTFEPLNEYPEF